MRWHICEKFHKLWNTLKAASFGRVPYTANTQRGVRYLVMEHTSNRYKSHQRVGDHYGCVIRFIYPAT